MSGSEPYWLRKRLWKTAALLERSAVIRWLISPLVSLLRLHAAIGRKMAPSIRTWIDRALTPRRSGRDFVLGVPAILVFIGFAAATVMGQYQQRNAAQRLNYLGQQALHAGNPHVAQIYLRKAMLSEQIDPRQTIFALAQAYRATEEFDRSNALIQSLAPLGKAGYPSAHRYLALRTASQVLKTKRVDDLEAWHWHLSHADRAESTDLQKCWGMYFLIRGEFDDARAHLRRAAQQEPALWLQVAELDARLQDREAIGKTLETARQQLEQSVRQDPVDEKNRLLYVTALLNLGDFSEAEQTLTEGLQESDSRRLQRLLAVVRIKRYDAAIENPEQSADAVKHLYRALDGDPSFRPALTRLVAFARSDPQRLQEARETLQQLLASGDASAMSHFTLGSLEWTAGNDELAEFHMRRAIELDEHLDVVANNLAYLMAQSDEGDLKAALSFAQQAVRADTDNPNYRDTRGLVLEKLGRLSEAADDYQHALKTSPNPAPLQQKLARIYDRLGDAERADQYRRATRRNSDTPADTGFAL